MKGLDVLFAAEHLSPPAGGAELFALELLEGLAARGHRVRAVSLGHAPADAPAAVEMQFASAPEPSDAYWRTKRLRREAVELAVRAALAERRADVVVTQLHAAPGAVAAGTEAGSATVLVLPSYESLCKYAFDAGSGCSPAFDCRSCPGARRLAPDEQGELLQSRNAHARSLAAAGALIAASRSVAESVERWCGRHPEVVYPVVAHPGSTRGDPEGPVVAIARWNANKGVALLEPIVRALAHRRFRIVDTGLSPDLARRLAALPNIELVPPAPVASLLDGASVALVPSQSEEAFGRTAFEANAAGVPALASDAGGLREHVPESLLVQPRGEPPAWVAALQALEDPVQWAAARTEGLNAGGRFLRADAVGQVERLLAALAPSPRR